MKRYILQIALDSELTVDEIEDALREWCVEGDEVLRGVVKLSETEVEPEKSDSDE